MSRHNRDRRQWRCSACKAPMHAALAEAQKPAIDAVNAGGRVRVDPQVIHVCGACHTCHYADGDRLRPLTPAELLDLHVTIPRTMEAAARGEFDPRPHEAGRLVFAREAQS